MCSAPRARRLRNRLLRGGGSGHALHGRLRRRRRPGTPVRGLDRRNQQTILPVPLRTVPRHTLQRQQPLQHRTGILDRAAQQLGHRRLGSGGVLRKTPRSHRHPAIRTRIQRQQQHGQTVSSRPPPPTSGEKPGRSRRLVPRRPPRAQHRLAETEEGREVPLTQQRQRVKPLPTPCLLQRQQLEVEGVGPARGVPRADARRDPARPDTRDDRVSDVGDPVAEPSGQIPRHSDHMRGVDRRLREKKHRSETHGIARPIESRVIKDGPHSREQRTAHAPHEDEVLVGSEHRPAATPETFRIGRSGREGRGRMYWWTGGRTLSVCFGHDCASPRTGSYDGLQSRRYEGNSHRQPAPPGEVGRPDAR